MIRHRFSWQFLGLECVEIVWAGVEADWGASPIPGEFWGIPGQPESAPIIRPPAPAPFDSGSRGIGYLDLDVGFPRIPKLSRMPKIFRIPKQPMLTT